MELLAVLFGLYGLQCFVHLPRGAVGFLRWGREFYPRPGPGWIAAVPLPSSLVWIGERLPWIAAAGALDARGVAPRFLSTGLMASRIPFDPAGVRAVERDGTLLRVNGRPFARTATEPGAERLHSLLATAERGREVFERRVGELLGEELSLARFEAARRHFLEQTRWHRALVDGYGLALGVGFPGVAVVVGVEAALLRAAPLLALLHLACLVSYARSDRRLRKVDRLARLQSWLELALYPPALLRSAQRLHGEVLARFHPATLAAALLPSERRRSFLRAELVRARFAAQPTGTAELASLEQRALEALIAEAGESASALLAPPRRPHPSALAYCPACEVGYRRGDGDCSDCGLPLSPYPA